MSSLENFIKLDSKVKSLSKMTKIIVVTKTFDIEAIKPILDFGHNDFGENRVNEASKKWQNFLDHKRINLHLIGKLQSNKAKEALLTFNYIHSLDSIKLAEQLHKYEIILKKNAKYFIQINIGNEMQKGGINVNDLPDFLKICKINYKLNIIGLMCIPPQNMNPIPFFTKMNEIAKLHSLPDLSMGMSEDFSSAIECGSTYIRVGSLIFGSRVK
jgi:pyridoxal phosphate enzyme (YggS family)